MTVGSLNPNPNPKPEQIEQRTLTRMTEKDQIESKTVSQTPIMVFTPASTPPMKTKDRLVEREADNNYATLMPSRVGE